MRHRVAIIGAGGIAKGHLEAVVKINALDLVAVADISKEKAEEAAVHYNISAYTDYKEMIQQEKPDIAVITLPHFLHKEAALFCADAGCHMMLEKPMALSVQECDEIIAAVADNNVQLMVGHTQHYLPANRKAKQLLAEIDLGELVMVNDHRHVNYFSSSRPDWFLEKSQSGGGIMMNLGSHSIDKIQWLTNSRMQKIWSRLSFHGDRGNVEGSGVLMLETEQGVPVTIAQSGYKGYTKNETEFVFTNGKMKLQAGSGLWISREQEIEKVDISTQTELPFVLQYNDLIDAIVGKRPLECDGHYGKSVIAVVEAIYTSHETGTVVTI